MKIESEFEKLMSWKFCNSTSPSELLQKAGSLIDISAVLIRPQGCDLAITWLDSLIAQGPDLKPLSEAHYFMAVAWAEKRRFQHGDNRESSWSWNQPEIEKELIHLRRAISTSEKLAATESSSENDQITQTVRLCQMHTNLGNTLSNIGRTVEAIAEWDRALKLRPDFAMALANRSRGLISYGDHLYDPGHIKVMYRKAYSDLTAGLEYGVEPHSEPYFQWLFKRLLENIPKSDLSKEFRLEEFSLGRTVKEKRYRRWCLANRMFLNPLNDLGEYSIASHDVIHCPDITTKNPIIPPYFGFFNQLKQEYCAARYFLFEGIHAKGVHFADRGVLLFNTLDYPIYSIGAEQIKVAFRMAYSIFDKVAFFLNDYLNLGDRERDVSFRRVWFKKDMKNLKSQFAYLDNLPFRGLFWLSRDYIEGSEIYSDAIAPDAREVASLRNHAEHKYLKLKEFLSEEASEENATDMFMDRMARSISMQGFASKTMRVLKDVRSSLIYLSMGIHYEEQRKRDLSEQVAPIHLPQFRDNWKRL